MEAAQNAIRGLDTKALSSCLPTLAKGLCVWWTTHSDVETTKALLADGSIALPSYLQGELESREGRNGRGHLWIAKGIELPHGIPWDDSKLEAKIINRGSHGGIVVRQEDFLLVSGLPGFVTDVGLNRIAPATGGDIRIAQKVTDALAAIPGGAQLDRYFGVSSGVPEQPIAEGQESDALLKRLRDATQSPEVGLLSLLGDIGKHVDTSGADPDALRALMRRPGKAKGSNDG